MEVHHHSHPSTSSGHRKKWTHYFWEFLMLFLAVFCGFLAEYQLEHKIENQREYKLMKSFMRDLAADTLRLGNIISGRLEKMWMMDSLSSILNAGPPYDSTGIIYNYAVFINRTFQYRFVPTEGTLLQLKNAGGLRLIRKLYVADSIVRYDAAIRTLQRQQDLEESVMADYRGIAHRFFDGRIFNKMMNAENIPSPIPGHPPLTPFTRPDLNEFNYKLFLVQAQNRVNRRESLRLLVQSRNLINLLQKEYHFQ